MLGMMMNSPLLVSTILRHAATYHGTTEIVSKTVEGPIHRYTYADLSKRSQKLAKLFYGRALVRRRRMEGHDEQVFAERCAYAPLHLISRQQLKRADRVEGRRSGRMHCRRVFPHPDQARAGLLVGREMQAGEFRDRVPQAIIKRA